MGRPRILDGEKKVPLVISVPRKHLDKVGVDVAKKVAFIAIEKKFKEPTVARNQSNLLDAISECDGTGRS